MSVWCIMCVPVHVYAVIACVDGGQRSISSVCWELEFANLAGMAGEQALGAHLSLPPQHGD